MQGNTSESTAESSARDYRETATNAGGRTSLRQAARCAVRNWYADNASSLGAALAFYCAFSLGPLLIILVTVSGWIVGAEAAYGYVGSQLRLLFGASSAQVLLDAMRSSQSADGVAATIVSVITLLIGATTVFAALESALELIWGKRSATLLGWRGFARTRLLSFGLILAIGFLLLVSLAITTALAALRGYVTARFTGLVVFIGATDFVFSIALSTVLVAVIYRYMPATRLAWRPVLGGALATALLLHFGRWAIGLYLGKATQPSAFGAAASFVALLLWLYYSAQIFLLGAEFTACLANSRGSDAAAGARAEASAAAPPAPRP
jgi:membrane protein